MKYLIIGISLVCILSFLTACNDDEQVDGTVYTTYQYYNKTNQSVLFKTYNNMELMNNEIIEPQGYLELKDSILIASGPGIVAPFQSIDEIIIEFEDAQKCLSNYQKLWNFKEYDNFNENMFHMENNTLIYNIDSEELEKAIACD